MKQVPAENSTPRVLAVCLGGLGDTILFSPVLRALTHRYPNGHLDLLAASPLTLDLYGNHPAIAARYHIATHRGRWLHNATLLTRFGLHVRHRRYDLAVYPSGLNRSIRLILQAAAGIRHSHQSGHASRASTDLECNVALARHFWPDASVHDTLIRWNEADTRALATVLPAPDVAAMRDIVIYPSQDFGGRPRRWPLADLAAAADALKRQLAPARIIVVGGTTEHREWNALPYRTEDINLAGQISVRATAALLAQATLAICSDGGLMHLAGAVDCPMVALMPHTASSYRPPGRRTVILGPGPIRVANVVAAATQLLATQRLG